MNSNGFSGTDIIGFDHNWSDADGYPVELVRNSISVLLRTHLHTLHISSRWRIRNLRLTEYRSTVMQAQSATRIHSTMRIRRRTSTSRNALANSTAIGGATSRSAVSCPNLYLESSDHFSSCSGIRTTCEPLISMEECMYVCTELFILSFIGAVNHHARNAAMWNLALDGNGNPKLPGTTSCGGSDPCRGVVTINSDGTYELNQECTYHLASCLVERTFESGR